ncbi:hypothetical protein [Erythrobacter sp. JK5]|uniref:hypothetical protein n=1 Tax=Erythrobacter sp. JK5 TaxID=2829500 RepID=UPI001BA927EE|nr:hypothetical protein [Erythrobacter sp. JK5]QUL38359.1 hypothetical protein KDC96_02790 [Erythrobacter sp. JK5]
MKVFLIAGGLALSALAVPQAAFAQQDQAAAGIVVTGKFQKDWDRGHKLEAEGLRDLQSAQRDLVEYSADVVNAQDLRETSRSRADNARQALESLTARPFFSSADEAHKWSKQVESAAADWAKYDERSDKGAKDFEKAQSRQQKAQEAVDKAQAKIDKGRGMKADAELASQRASIR